MSHKKVTQELVDLAGNLYKKYGTGSKVQNELGLSHRLTYTLLHKSGVHIPGRHETKPCRIKLSSEIAPQVINDYLKGASWEELTQKYGAGRYAISGLLKRNNTSIKELHILKQRLPESKELEVCELYTRGGLSQAEIGKKFSIGQNQISRVLRKHNICSKRAAGPGHQSWKGGRTVGPGGYILVKVGHLDDPTLGKIPRSGYILEHRLVMARYLGRPITKNETIHHIDGNRKNNSIENLQLRIGKHGTGSTYCCADCGSKRIKPVII